MTIWTEHPMYGDLIEMGDFIRAIWSFSFIDYDGIGYYATSRFISDIPVRPSDYPEIKRGFSHVIWFNR